MPKIRNIAGHPYYGSTVSFATMHDKQRVVSHYFKALLAIDLKVPHVDTDILGTFSGEVARTQSMLDTALRKARMGMQAEHLSLGIASEGSFGPHPFIPFIYAGNELMVFVDDVRGITISESIIVSKTNFAHIMLAKQEVPDSFLKQVQFPSHGLIVKGEGQNPLIVKGIKRHDELSVALKKCFDASNSGRVILETDMRAHMNPMRMQSIEFLAQKIVERIATLCPACDLPGFGILGMERGLPCGLCQTPTQEIKSKFLTCPFCSFIKPITHQRIYKPADPAQCQECNP